MNCVIYRCSRQNEMYLYRREDLDATELPHALLARLGRLTEVMQLDLSRRERLARVDIDAVRRALAETGWYLQMPPDGQVHAHLDDGD